MDWQYTLIHLFLHVCEQYQRRLCVVAQRLSNNHAPAFSDEEVLTVYLFGLMQQRRTLTDIYAYTRDHLMAFFPKLPSYVAFVQRLNRLADAFPLLVEAALEACPRQSSGERPAERSGEPTDYIIDSFPVVMAQQKRSAWARVAPHIAGKGFCASKNLYFYGVKVHVVARRRPGTMPLPLYIGLAPGPANDLTVARQILPRLHEGRLFADKIYADRELGERLAAEQNLHLCTPVKKRKGQTDVLLTEKVYSRRVSQRRQPIESLFNWIEQKTGIEVASKVRSFEGLLVHVFGRLAAAMWILAFYP
ncbi:transposase [Rhodocaloribacter litoris]|uniref:transposase n=1 Tax=Rhodocaloribacter litoris TaxID=2558931 RepID=UPI001E56ECD5|nr:transposase [Rhodocaloribacter litoris]QXD15829.1 transposase [Rhodocaloribacter litoris]QXD16469.1 transposase [Rhodocaloribacter litoris]QXD17002.1 transposase [Rhodocaloribacter litoris]